MRRASARGGGIRRALKFAGFVLVLAVLVAVGIQVWFYARIAWWATHDPESTAFMNQRLENLRAADPRAALQVRWVPYGQISAQLKRAVIAAEDAKFVDHDGFDWEAIQQAMEKNEREGRTVSGASTISQQLAKNLFLSGERSWLRKGQEAVITAMIEHRLTKRRILELYLNVAEWGEGVFGVEAAARHHFGVAAADLTPYQAAWLAAILPSPRRYRRGTTTPYLEQRVRTISESMGMAQIP